MRQILHTYQLRLTNLSQANRSLKLARLSKRRDIDLMDLGWIEHENPEALLSRLIAGKDARLIQRLDPRHEATNLVDRRLNQIYRTVRTLFEETGSYDLFVGYPFVEGKFLDGSVARCPVLLFPIRLHRDLQSKPRWRLEVLDNEPVTFNKTFFLAYEQFQQRRLPAEFWEEEIEPNKDWLAWVNALYQQVKTYELDLNFNPRLFDLRLEHFPDHLKETLDKFKSGVLKFRSQAVLGIFPQSDSALLHDYEVLAQQAEAFPLDILFRPKPGPDPKAQTYIKEEDRYFVTPVDQSQESALLRIKGQESLVIHGPPGTGKSQVIVNIIADAMAHGKKVLLVSQKRAALDVVYKRLSGLGLGQFAVLVHDYRHDRAAIYRQIKQLIEAIPDYQREMRDLNLTQWEHAYHRVSREADQLKRDFEALFEALTQPQRFGLNMHRLYLQSEMQTQVWPLGAVARKLDADQLEALVAKFRVLCDYLDLFDPEHPWRERLSFRLYGYEEQAQLKVQLARLPDQLRHLQNRYHTLSQRLSTRILDPALNEERIGTFRKLDHALQLPQTRENLAAIHQEPDPAEQLGKNLNQLSQALDKLDQRKLLDDGDWPKIEALEKHVKHFQAQRKKPLRWLNFAFLRARWYLHTLLKRQEKKPDAAVLRQLEKELRDFRRVRRFYVKHHERPFFSDLSLLDPQSDKRRWLSEKRADLTVYASLKAIKYYPKWKPRFTKGAFDLGHWQQAIHQIEALASFNEEMAEWQRQSQLFLHASQIEKLKAGLAKPEQGKAYAQALSTSFERDVADLKSLDVHLADFSRAEQLALETLTDQLRPGLEEIAFIHQLQQSIYAHWIEEAERGQPILAEVSSRSWGRKERAFAEKLQKRREQVAELVQRRVKERILGIIEYNRLKNPITYRSLLHQVSKKRRLWSVRKLVRECWSQGLPELAPCWMASPESVAAIFPMQAEWFDVVVFDEASQCFVERALPVILRSKQSVIAGDSKQLQPSDLYQVKYEEAESEFVENEIALEVESVLDLAQLSLGEAALRWHYRSREEALINFSNHAFYEGSLRVMPPALPDSRYQPPLEWISVAGKWEQQRNRPEAERVLVLIESLIQREPMPSIGVVTFNFFQQELIKDLLDERLQLLAQQDPVRYERLQASMSLTEASEFQGLFVKNIENVQGDERDIIIFSIGYAPDARGKLVARFGLLNQAGGENRLNVAITRARQKNYVLCSFEPGALQVEQATHPGPKLLQQYLRYAKAISEGREADALRLLDAQETSPARYAPLNPIADTLAAALRAVGYQVDRNLGDTRYQLDLAIKRRAEDEGYLLGIECEGPHYFSGESAKEREVYRRELLRARGWKLHRVWARNYWRDREGELKKILKKLE